MKKIFIIIFLSLAILCISGCGCSKRVKSNSAFNGKEISLDFNSMDQISSDIKDAIEMGLNDASPVIMKDGHFRIEKNNYSYNSEEGTTKSVVNFYNFEIDARPDDNNSIVFFKGLITIDFEHVTDGSEFGGNYIINSVGHKVIEFEINDRGKASYDEETGTFTILIPELKEKGTINQTTQKTTTTKSGSKDIEDPVANNWDIDDDWKNVKIVFTTHSK